MVVHYLLYELLVFFSVVLVGGLLAFAHIHGEAGTPSLRIRSAAVGPNEQSGSVSGRGALLFRRCKNTPVIATFDIIPSPHTRITAPSLLLAFAHIHGEAGTPSLRIRSAAVGPNERPVLWVEGVHYYFVDAKTAERPLCNSKWNSLCHAVASCQYYFDERTTKQFEIKCCVARFVPSQKHSDAPLISNWKCCVAWFAPIITLSAQNW
jgi:hypothetical protein